MNFGFTKTKSKLGMAELKVIGGNSQFCKIRIVFNYFFLSCKEILTLGVSRISDPI